MKYLRATGVGRTVNNLTKHDGVVGQAATALVAKWKREVGSSDQDERRHTNDNENIEPSTRNNYTDSQGNGTSSTPRSDSRDQTVHNSQPVSWSTENTITSKSSCSVKSPQENCSQWGKESSKNCDEEMSKSHRSHSFTSRSSAHSSVWSDYCTEKTKNSKRKDCGKTNHRKRRHIDIDSTMGTSFAEALGMLDVPSTSKVKKLPNDRSSLISKTAISSRHTKFGICSPLDETPILLTKRPQLEHPTLDISLDLSPSTVTEAWTLEPALRTSKPRQQTIQLTDEVTTNIISRTSKTKVFSGNKGSKCKVPTLFELCIHLLQDNVDCEYSYFIVP